MWSPWIVIPVVGAFILCYYGIVMQRARTRVCLSITRSEIVSVAFIKMQIKLCIGCYCRWGW